MASRWPAVRLSPMHAFTGRGLESLSSPLYHIYCSRARLLPRGRLLTPGCRVDRQVSTITCSWRPRPTSSSFPSARMASAAYAVQSPDRGRRFRLGDGDCRAALHRMVVSNRGAHRRASTLSLGSPGPARHRSNWSASSYMESGDLSCDRAISHTLLGASSRRARVASWCCGSSYRNACIARAQTS